MDMDMAWMGWQGLCYRHTASLRNKQGVFGKRVPVAMLDGPGRNTLVRWETRIGHTRCLVMDESRMSWSCNVGRRRLCDQSRLFGIRVVWQ